VGYIKHKTMSTQEGNINFEYDKQIGQKFNAWKAALLLTGKSVTFVAFYNQLSTQEQLKISVTKTGNPIVRCSRLNLNNKRL
jgi:hypothetical protein